jgi:hypothetical protein
MSKRILVVEGQKDNRQIIRDTLGGSGYQITEVEDGEQALTAIAKQRPDLILMDIQLPIMDGYTATSSRKHCCWVIRDRDAASGTRCANCASGGGAERGRRPFHRPGGGASNSDGPNRAAASRGADHRHSRPDGARGR